MKKTWLVLSWVGATALVSFITFQGLSAAQGGVNDSPLTPVVVATTVVAGGPSTTDVTVIEIGDGPSASSTTSTSIEDSGTSGGARPADGATAAPAGGSGSVAATTSTTVAVTTSTTTGATTSTTTGGGSSTTSTTTPSTTTTIAAAWTTTTITSPGGSVTVSYRPGEVRYDAAAPAAGFTMDIKETGPEVRVEFESDDLGDYEIRARWTSGGFDSEVNEKG